jgi:hypothetical protein
MLARVGWRAAALVVVGAAIAWGMDTGRFPEGYGRGGFAGGWGGSPFRDRLVIHEWGTFTSLQDEQGRPIGGVNADDEPAPAFVHRIADSLMLGPGATAPLLLKGAPRCHPDATMRLETPVVYFYPPRGADLPLLVDIEVAFRGGWLSEFYPDAQFEAPGVDGARQFGPISETTTGRLAWKNLKLGVEGDGPQTDSPVWLAPRRVPAAMVETEGGERERFLFYRGLGRVESPVAVSREESGERLVVTENFPSGDGRLRHEIVPQMWLVDIRRDNTCAFRELGAFEAACDDRPQQVATTSARFKDSDYSPGNVDALVASMTDELVADGLFPAEARALLATWKASYFESAGLRLFYLLPRAWTDRTLPLTTSAAADVVRTMVGRIEIVTPAQRRLLGKIAAGPASDPKWLEVDPISCRGLPEPPADFSAYQELGRFRNALVLDELARRPTAELEAFIKNYGLGGYRPVKQEDLRDEHRLSQTPATRSGGAGAHGRY